MPTFLHHLSPDLALLTATAGLCLIFLELNRPGRVLPGSLGLLLTLLAVAALLQTSPNSWALALLASSAVTLALNLYRLLPTWLLAAATLGMILAFRFLPRSPSVHIATAFLCGTLLGTLSAVLSRIALRARQAKAIH